MDKDEVAPWWAKNSKEAYDSGLDGLARALQSLFSARSGERVGPVGFPRSKKKSGRRSCRFTTGAIGVLDDRHVKLPRLGALRKKEPTRKHESCSTTVDSRSSPPRSPNKPGGGSPASRARLSAKTRRSSSPTVRTRHRSGPEPSAQSCRLWAAGAKGSTRRREWLGDAQRAWRRARSTRPEASGEACSRHRLGGEDRHRLAARRGCPTVLAFAHGLVTARRRRVHT